MRFSIALFAVVAAPLALAQTGTLDQSAPRTNAWYNEDASFLVWQQQIRCGVAGQLEGVKVTITSQLPDATFHLRIRKGAGPSGQPILADELVKTVVGGNTLEEVFVNFTPANIMLAAGEDFVMETQGTDSGAGLIGSYVDPAQGPPLYPYALFLNDGVFPDGWRHGFDTYMLVGHSCEPCDANCDGSVNQFDIQPFVNAIATHHGCSPCAGDTNDDGTANTFDINDFIDCLVP